jgi:hypothetical protein
MDIGGMQDTPELTEFRRTLIDKYLRGGVSHTVRPVSTIASRALGGWVPLTFEQQDLWHLARTVAEIPVFTECVTLHLPGPLDVPTLERSFGEILKRHEAWRTSFPMLDGQPIQMIHPVSTVTLPVVDLRHLPEAAREVEAVRLATEDARQPFDLADGPLVRARLVRLGDAHHRLYLTLHYIIFDGVTLYHVLLPELRALYDTFASGRDSPLPPLPIRHADYALWQRERLQGDVLTEHLAYWKRQLTGAAWTVTLPTDYPRPATKSYRGAMHQFALTRDLTDGLKALSRQEGVTLFMVLLAAFAILLHCYTGHDDMLVGTKTAGRKRPEVQGLMGYFLHILPLRINLAGNPSVRELLGRAREVTIGAVAHEDVPLDRLIAEVRPPNYLSPPLLIPVMLTVEPPLHAHPSGWTLTQMDVETGTSKVDLYLELDDRPEGLIGRFEYSTDLFEAATIARMARRWQRLLDEMVVDPSRRLSALPMLTAAGPIGCATDDLSA